MSFLSTGTARRLRVVPKAASSAFAKNSYPAYPAMPHPSCFVVLSFEPIWPQTLTGSTHSSSKILETVTTATAQRLQKTSNPSIPSAQKVHGPLYLPLFLTSSLSRLPAATWFLATKQSYQVNSILLMYASSLHCRRRETLPV